MDYLPWFILVQLLVCIGTFVAGVVWGTRQEARTWAAKGRVLRGRRQYQGRFYWVLEESDACARRLLISILDKEEALAIADGYADAKPYDEEEPTSLHKPTARRV